MQDNDDVTGTMDPARARPESAIDDESLFARVAAGDSQALRRFYQLYYRRLHRFLLRITRDPQLADEAVNDTLMVVWQQAGTFRHESRISTWVMGIAYRRALKALEAQRRSRAAVEAERQRRDALEASGHADDVEALAARGDWLERALASRAGWATRAGRALGAGLAGGTHGARAAGTSGQRQRHKDQDQQQC